MVYAGFVLPYSGATAPGFHGVLSLQTARLGRLQELFRAQETFLPNIKKDLTHILRKIDYIICMLYIYQFPDWTRFRFDHARVLDALGKARFCEGRLAGMLSFIGARDLETGLVTEDIVANFAIDGITLDADSVRTDVALRAQGSSAHIQNYIGAIENFTAPLSQERLLNWHSALAGNRKATWRDNKSEVSADNGTLHFSGPGPERLNSEMEYFLRWFENTPMDGTIKAAVAHFWFLTLRPFDTANGRLARAITALQLSRAQNSARIHYSLNQQILKNRDEYFRTLNKAQCGNGDLTEWILWFLKQIEAAVQTSESAIEFQTRRFRFLAQHSGVQTTEREQVLLNASLMGELPKDFTAKDVAAIFGTSHDTALREIQSLIDKGLVRASKKGGRSRTYSVVE